MGRRPTEIEVERDRATNHHVRLRLGQPVRHLGELWVIRHIVWSNPIRLGLAPFPAAVARVVDVEPDLLFWNEGMGEWEVLKPTPTVAAEG